MNSGEIKDLNVQRKTQKSTKTKVGIFIQFQAWKSFLTWRTTQMPYKGKIDRFNYVKYLRFFLPKASTNIIKLYGEI